MIQRGPIKTGLFQPCLLCVLWLWHLADGLSGIIPINEEGWKRVKSGGMGGVEGLLQVIV